MLSAQPMRQPVKLGSTMRASVLAIMQSFKPDVNRLEKGGHILYKLLVDKAHPALIEAACEQLAINTYR